MNGLPLEVIHDPTIVDSSPAARRVEGWVLKSGCVECFSLALGHKKVGRMRGGVDCLGRPTDWATGADAGAVAGAGAGREREIEQ